MPSKEGVGGIPEQRSMDENVQGVPELSIKMIKSPSMGFRCQCRAASGEMCFQRRLSMSRRQLLRVTAGCVQGTVCAGSSGDKTHVSARCWGCETRGGVRVMGWWKGSGSGLA